MIDSKMRCMVIWNQRWITTAAMRVSRGAEVRCVVNGKDVGVPMRREDPTVEYATSREIVAWLLFPEDDANMSVELWMGDGTLYAYKMENSQGFFTAWP